ncbi:MAG: hypothetical protein OEW81_13445 [Gammaproteobacteria bacterium]|nr:hypothetical protein [Gammaproteobacteria bacterium]
MAMVLGACAGTQVSNTRNSAVAGDTRYGNVLVIFLADSFDARRYLETEIVKKLNERGTSAVRSTSMMDSRTPVNRDTFLAMVDKIKADAVLVTQIADLQSKGEVVDMNPQATYNITPTYYYNVWGVDLTEYKEPQAVNFEHELALATQLYSVDTKNVVWAIESHSRIRQDFDEERKYSVFVDEATAIVRQLARDGMLKK